MKPSQIVDYEYVKDFEKRPEKLLIDVREPAELAADGRIPFSINIPCELWCGKKFMNKRSWLPIKTRHADVVQCDFMKS